MDDPASSLLFVFFQSAEAAEFPSLMTVFWEFLLVLFFVLLNAFFVASEFALVSSKRPRIETMADAGSGGAKAALRLLANPTLFISAVQLGVTLSSLAL